MIEIFSEFCYTISVSVHHPKTVVFWDHADTPLIEKFFLYDGRPVIQPEKLRELDTTEIAIPYGNGARVPVQKYRDLLRLWSAYMDETAVYVMLGAELQGRTHYAMPVKKGLYDMIGYARQVDEARNSYRKKNEEGGDLYVDDGTLKIKLTSGEFLSGFRKEDKLIPIITATVFLSDDEWDGPVDLHGMMDVKDKELLKFIPNYPINLIAPANMSDADFEKFNTKLGLAMKVLKYQKAGAVEVIEATNHEKIDRDTAVFLNRVANLGLEFEEKEEQIDMCKAMEDYTKKQRITGVIQGLQMAGVSDNDIVSKVIESFNVTKEYVLALLAPQKA